MKISKLSLLSGLSISAVSAYFSIIGILTIYPAAFWPILSMGVCLEIAKLVAILWLKQNWEFAPILVKSYLMTAVSVLMIITAVGSYGFLSKAHLDQGASTVDNSAKIAQLSYRISREQSNITDDEKVIKQLDDTIDSYLGKDRTDKSLAVRRSQVPQRKQLKADIDETQQRIDDLNTQKFQLDSAVRKIQLEVGPIRYISELFYGTADDATKNIESAVRMFTLLIIWALDPLAVALLIAANHSILRLRNKAEIKLQEDKRSVSSGDIANDTSNSEACSVILEEFNETETPSTEESKACYEELYTLDEHIQNETETSSSYDSAESQVCNDDTSAPIQEPAEEIVQLVPIQEPAEDKNLSYEGDIMDISVSTKSMQEAIRQALNIQEDTILDEPKDLVDKHVLAPFVSESLLPGAEDWESDTPVPDLTSAEVQEVSEIVPTQPAVQQSAVYREILGNHPHFIPQKVHEELNINHVQLASVADVDIHKEVAPVVNNTKYPKALSWLAEFKRSLNG